VPVVLLRSSHITSPIPVYVAFARIALTVLASRTGIVQIMKNSLGASPGLDYVIRFLASTITETVCDASFWCSAAVMRAVVLHFLGHDLTPSFVVGAKLRKDVGVLRRRITRCWLPVLVLRAGAVDGPTSAAAAFAHIERDLVSKLHRLEIRGFVEYLATISSLTFVSYMRTLTCPDLANRSWTSAV
jgi:hypothetical protein